MEIILVKQVRKLGKIGDTIKVKCGFARNFLIPQGIALASTQANREIFEHRKKEFEAQNSENKKSAEQLAKTLSGKDVTFIAQAALDSKLYGSIGSKEIAKKLESAGYDVHYANITLDTTIKYLGIYDVTLQLHSDVTCHITVNVAKSEAEAVEALNTYKNHNSAEAAPTEETANLA